MWKVLVMEKNVASIKADVACRYFGFFLRSSHFVFTSVKGTFLEIP